MRLDLVMSDSVLGHCLKGVISKTSIMSFDDAMQPAADPAAEPVATPEEATEAPAEATETKTEEAAA